MLEHAQNEGNFVAANPNVRVFASLPMRFNLIGSDAHVYASGVPCDLLYVDCRCHDSTNGFLVLVFLEGAPPGRYPEEHWWRRRESNPRPQALRYTIYMFSYVIGSHLTLPD